MHIWLHKLEKLVDALIPPLLLLLLFVVGAELFFHERFAAILHYADHIDLVIIAVFAADLAFKYSRVRKIPKFVRKYWLEIIATIPFFLVFRFTEFLGLQELIERGQVAAHEAAELPKLEREAGVIVKESGKASRTLRLLRTFRAFSRLPRFLKVLPFYEKPTGRHHWHEKG